MVERNNGIFNTIILKLERENTTASPALLVSRACFMANMFHGSRILIAFQLARGYSTSIAGITARGISQDILA